MNKAAGRMVKETLELCLGQGGEKLYGNRLGLWVCCSDKVFVSCGLYERNYVTKRLGIGIKFTIY
jgi:hypothetical protein